jgi:hypothetical protein
MKKLVGVSAVVAAALMSPPAWAATSENAANAEAVLRQCVIMRTTGADRVLTAQWMFAAMSKSPHISGLATVTAQQKSELDRGFAQLITRIAVKDCLEQIETLAAGDIKGTFELVGGALGEIAMKELMTDKNVEKAIGEYTDYLSEDDFKPLIDRVDANQSK